MASRHQDRSEAVERIRADLRTSGGRLRFKSLDKLFASLKGLLRDSNWNVRRDTIALLGEVIPKAGKNAASCIQHVLPALVFNLGDTKGAIRRGALAGIRTCYDHRPDDIELAGVLIEEGIENPETRVRGEALRFMQCALPWDQSTDHEILLFGEAIVGRLRDVDTDVLLAACKVLERLPDQIGEESFTALIASLHPTLQSLYTSVLTVHRQQNAAPSVAGSDASTTGGNALEFGLISSATLASLCDERYEVRCDGMEDLEAAVNRVEYATAITPHLPGLLDLLEQLTGDTNLKVALGALEVMGLVVQKVGYPMRIELPKMMGPLLRMFGDSQVVVRQAVGKLMYRFMQFLTPTPVFEVLLASLNDRNWRVREEVCNVVILNVAKFPGQQLDFTKIVNALQPLLMDEKKRVKFVCLEAFSAVRKALGEVAYESVLQQNVPPAVIEEMELSGAGAQAQMRHSDGTTAMNASSPLVGRRGAPRNGSARESPAPSAGRIARSASKKLPWNNDGDGAGRSGDGSYTPSPSSANRRARGDRGPFGDNRARSGSTGSIMSGRVRSGRGRADSERLLVRADSEGGQSGGGIARAPNQRTEHTSGPYVPSTPDTGRPRRERNQSASSDARESPFPATARVRTRPGSMNRRPSYSEDAPADALSQSWGSSASGWGDKTPTPRSCIPGPSSARSRHTSSDSYVDSTLALIEQAQSPSSSESRDTPSAGSGIPAQSPAGRAPSARSVASSGIPSPASVAAPSAPPPASATREKQVSRARARSAKGSPFHVHPTTPSGSRGRGPSAKTRARSTSRTMPADEEPDEPDDATVISNLTRSFGQHSLDVGGEQNGVPGASSPVDRENDLASPPAIAVPEPQQAAKRPSPRSPRKTPHLPRVARTEPKAQPPLSPRRMASEPEGLSKFELELIAQAKGNAASNFQATRTALPTRDDAGDDSEGDTGSDDGSGGSEAYSDGEDDHTAASSVRQSPALSASFKQSLKGRARRSSSNNSSSGDPFSPSPPAPGVVSTPRKQPSPKPEKTPRTPPLRRSPAPQAQSRSRSPQPKTPRTPPSRHSPPKGAKGTPRGMSGTSPGTESGAAAAPGSASSKRSQPRTPSGRSGGPPRLKRTDRTTSSHAPKSASSGSAARVLAAGAADADSLLVPLSDVGPHHNPGIALKGAFTALKKGAIQETWEQATTGLVAIRQVLQHNSDVIANSLHVVVEAVIVEVQNLRSLVSRLAIMTVADIVERLTKMMEGKELDAVVAALCKKAAAEAGSSFIIASITESMTRIIDATATGKYIAAIIPHASHKTAIVRKMVVVRVTAVTERAQSKIFAVKDLERILAAMCKFSSDNDPTVRWYARKTFHIMSAHEQFEKILQKSLPASLLATASGIVDKVRRSGPGDPPKDAKARTVSAGSGSMRSPAKSARRGVTATGRPGVSSPATPSSAASARTPTARRTPLKVGSATPRRGGTGGAAGQAMRPALQEELDALVTKLTSSDWKERDAAVDMTEEMAAREGGGLRSGIGRLMDAYAGRLADPNSKVNKKALETYRRMLPDLAPAFDGQGPIVNEIVAKLTPNLASKNKVIRDETSAALEEMFGHLGSAVLLAPLVQAAGFGNSKVKGASLAILTNKVAAFFEESPKVAKRQFVTLVGQLLGDVKQKADLARLLQSLVSYMGVGGVTQAASSLPPNKQKILAAELTAPVMSIGAVGRNPKRDRNRTV